MKKVLLLFLSFVLCISLCSCVDRSLNKTITFNDEYTEVYYNGRTYITYDNTNGKYRIKKDADNWIQIATMPYMLGATTTYYGNNAENPEFIINSRTITFFVREDIAINHDTELSVCDTELAYCFKISDVITDNFIAYNNNNAPYAQLPRLCNFYATFKEYQDVDIKLWINIFEYNGKLYLQDAWDSDYYEITDSFKKDLYRLGIDKFDYYDKDY